VDWKDYLPNETERRWTQMFVRLIDSGIAGFALQYSTCRNGISPVGYCWSGGNPTLGCHVGMTPQNGPCAAGPTRFDT